jgi:hypothetical protein
MQSLTVISHINATPDSVWNIIGDPGGISAWHPAIASSSLDGDARLCVLGNGAEIHEKVIAMDAGARSYTYTITESPLPLTGYKSTIQVSEEGTGAVVEWTADFEPAGAPAEEVVGLIKGVYAAGLAALRDKFPG